jgi:hypothetical protein
MTHNNSRQYVQITPTNILAEPPTDRQCIAYASFHSQSSLHRYRYRMKDVSCQEKAPFICQYNPGKKLYIAYITHIALEACTIC